MFILMFILVIAHSLAMLFHSFLLIERYVLEPLSMYLLMSLL